MTTATQIVNRAAELIGYKDPDETLSSADSTNFLAVLNDLVDEWNSRELYIVSTSELVKTVTTSPVTIGPGATIDVAARPIRLEDGSFSRINGVDYSIRWVTQEEYNSIVVKTTTGAFPNFGYYQASIPTAQLYLWPVPTAGVELHLVTLTQLTAFADLVTDYSLAPGYKKALEYSLAEELAPGRRQLDPLVAQKAASARRAIKTVNFEPPQLDNGPRYYTPYARFISGV